MSVRAILLLAALIPCVPICFFRPFFGVIVWTIISFGSPQWYAWGAAFYFPSAELIAIPTILGFMIFSRGWSRLISRESILLVIMWMWFVITTVVSVGTPLFEPNAEHTWYRLEFVSKVLLMVFLTMGIVDTLPRLRALVITMACCFSFYVVKAFPWMVMSGGSFRLYGPPKSMVEDNNDLGLALNMTLPLLFFLAQTETKPWLKRVFGSLFVMMIFGVFCTYSRGALLGLIAIMILMILRVKQRTVLIPVVILGVLVAVVFAPESWKSRMNLTKKEATLDGSAYSRLNAWTFGWRLVNDYPLTGGGFEVFNQRMFERYAPNANDVHGPHSVYFGVLGEHGFPGLALYLSLIGSCFWSLYKVARRAAYEGKDWAVAYANMFRYSILSFMACGVFLGRAYFDYYFTIVACVVIFKKCWNNYLNSELADEPEEDPSDSAMEGAAFAGGYRQ